MSKPQQKVEAKAPPVNAWTKGGKPGIKAAPKQNNKNKDRVAFALCCLVGKKVRVEKKDASQVEGVLVGAKYDGENSFLGCSLRFARVIKPEGDDNVHQEMNIPWDETAFVFSQDAGGMISEMETAVNGGRAPAKVAFTDTEISAQAASHGDRKLQAVDSSWVATDQGLDMNEGPGAWDQFEANRKLFGVESSFDENLYTTALDKNRVSEADKRRAEEVARSIEGKASSNVHVREDRGQITQNDSWDDEEALYSSVTRTESPGTYQPPHRRTNAGTGSAKAKGAAPAQNDIPDSKKDNSPKPGPGMSWAARVKGPTTAADGEIEEVDKTKSDAPVDPPVGTAPDVVAGKAGASSEERQRQIQDMKQFSNSMREKISSKSSPAEQQYPAEEDAAEGVKLDDSPAKLEAEKPEPATDSTVKVTEEPPKVESPAPADSAQEAKKTKMNVNAKEWKPRAAAQEFVPQQSQPQPQMVGMPFIPAGMHPQMMQQQYGMFSYPVFHPMMVPAGYPVFDPNQRPQGHHPMPGHPHPHVHPHPPPQQ